MKKRALCFMAVPFFLACAFAANPATASQPVRYPGGGDYPDPTGRWVVMWREATATRPHDLSLKDSRTGLVSELLEFGRYADALWSPDGNSLAITASDVSNESYAWIVRTHRPNELINIAKGLTRSLGKMPEIFDNGHVYFQVVRWTSPRTLLFTVHAYDSRPSYEYRATFEYHLGGRVRRVSKK